MLEFKDSVKVSINVEEPGYYMFLGKGSIGKTYLANILARRANYEPVYIKTFKDGQVYERGNKETAKVLMFDRLDMYFDDSVINDINIYGKKKPVLLDIKDFSVIDDSELEPDWGFVDIDLGDRNIVVRSL